MNIEVLDGTGGVLVIIKPMTQKERIETVDRVMEWTFSELYVKHGIKQNVNFRTDSTNNTDEALR